MVAALYVETNGAYFGLLGVDPWDEQRDARMYDGPYPVVAHPPCARWSRLAGFTEARFGYKRGDDGGCFAAALNAVRTYGGILEHPAHSAAFAHHGLQKPSVREGWTLDMDGGATCYIEQGRYGLPVKKATWLYAFGVELPELQWGYTPDGQGEEPNGPWGGIENWRDRWTKPKRDPNEPRKISGGSGFFRENRHNGLRSATPFEFRDVLIETARSAYALRKVAA